jgi:twitching motility protein PilT
MALIDTIIRAVKDYGASDLHLTTGSPPVLRVDGDILVLPHEPLTHQATEQFLFEIMSEEDRRLYERSKDIDFGYEIKGVVRLRCNVFEQMKGIGAVLRLIPTRILSIADLHLPEQILDFTEYNKGLVLITGPTGSGKSSTLAAMIDHVNATRKCHIITIEDPIEFVHESKMSLVNQREVGRNTKDFASALRAALREDPDVVLVGELRDLETIQLAVTAAETGHLVFGTLHSRTGPQTVDRLIDVFPEGAKAMIRVMLSESLKGVITQQLLKRASGHGRVPAVEMLKVNVAIANLIREGRTFQIQSQMQVMKREGAMTMDEALMQLVEKNHVSYDHALGAAEDREAFSRYFGRRNTTTRIMGHPQADVPEPQSSGQPKGETPASQPTHRVSRFTATRK